MIKINIWIPNPKHGKVKEIARSNNQINFIGNINDVVNKLQEITDNFNHLCTAQEYIMCRHHEQKK